VSAEPPAVSQVFVCRLSRRTPVYLPSMARCVRACQRFKPAFGATHEIALSSNVCFGICIVFPITKNRPNGRLFI
jgi:hypothetical protein